MYALYFLTWKSKNNLCVNKFSHKEALSFARQAVKKLEEIIESPIFDSKES